MQKTLDVLVRILSLRDAEKNSRGCEHAWDGCFSTLCVLNSDVGTELNLRHEVTAAPERKRIFRSLVKTQCRELHTVYSLAQDIYIRAICTDDTRRERCLNIYHERDYL